MRAARLSRVKRAGRLRRARRLRRVSSLSRVRRRVVERCGPLAWLRLSTKPPCVRDSG
jgi:hypothetical protein